MRYEVEFKFPITKRVDVAANLEQLNATAQQPVEQRDRYFNHPTRDFGETDEAFRIRSAGGADQPARSNCVTYKGPILDQVAKTRCEIEVPIADGPLNASRFAEILTCLGFRESLEVHKYRLPFRFTWEDREIELVFDTVDGLGAFVEMETITAGDERDAARDSLLRLAARLGLDATMSERRSYLQMLLEADVG